MRNVTRPAQLRLVGSDNDDVIKVYVVTPDKTRMGSGKNQHLRVCCALYPRLHALVGTRWDVELLVYVVREAA